MDLKIVCTGSLSTSPTTHFHFTLISLTSTSLSFSKQFCNYEILYLSTARYVISRYRICLAALLRHADGQHLRWRM